MPSDEEMEVLSDPDRGNGLATAKLTPIVYKELRRLAKHYLGNQARDLVTLQPTALVHEAYLRLVGSSGRDFRSRTHFIAAAAGAMRHVLIDHVRAFRAAKRGQGARPLTLIASDGEIGDGRQAYDLLELNDLIERLAEMSARAAQVVDLRVFGGLTTREIADVLGKSERTVKDDWRVGRAWLRSQLRNDEEA